MANSAPTRVVILQNLPAPYRLPIFDRLLDAPDLEVRIYFTGRPKSNRPSWTQRYGRDDVRVKYLSGIGIPVKGASADRININLGLKEILDGDPDVILLYGYQDLTNIVVALLSKLRNIPYIICAEVSYVWNQSILAKATSPLVKYLLKNASILVAGSYSCAKYFESQGVEERKIVIVPTFAQYGEISSRVDAQESEISFLRRDLSLKDKFVLLFVGRLVAYKGIEELLLAMEEVWQSESNAVLVVIGTGPMKEFVSKYGRLFPGRVLQFESVDYHTLLRLYAIADVHVMPSWHEAYGLVCGEALASGTPSIVTNTSGCSDLIVDGVNGILISPRDYRSLSRAILSLSQNPDLIKRLKSNARKSVEKHTVEEVSSLLKLAILKSQT